MSDFNQHYICINVFSYFIVIFSFKKRAHILLQQVYIIYTYLYISIKMTIRLIAENITLLYIHIYIYLHTHTNYLCDTIKQCHVIYLYSHFTCTLPQYKATSDMCTVIIMLEQYIYVCIIYTRFVRNIFCFLAVP